VHEDDLGGQRALAARTETCCHLVLGPTDPSLAVSAAFTSVEERGRNGVYGTRSRVRPRCGHQRRPKWKQPQRAEYSVTIIAARDGSQRCRQARLGTLACCDGCHQLELLDIKDLLDLRLSKNATDRYYSSGIEDRSNLVTCIRLAWLRSYNRCCQCRQPLCIVIMHQLRSTL
jgi:hypothetical protein